MMPGMMGMRPGMPGMAGNPMMMQMMMMNMMNMQLAAKNHGRGSLMMEMSAAKIEFFTSSRGSHQLSPEHQQEKWEMRSAFCLRMGFEKS